MIRVGVDKSGLEIKLRGLEQGLRDLAPVWPKVHEILLAFMKQHFASEGTYAGVRWRVLSPNYARWKAKHYPGKKILQLRGDLYGSLTQPRHASHVFRSGPSFMEFGTSDWKARIHQTGSLKIANRPPRRIVLPKLTKAEGEQIVDVMLAFMLRKVRTGR